MADIPLTPADGAGVCIGVDSLLKADIIVSTTAAAVSGVIRKSTGSNVSHSRLYIGNGEIIEAVGDGVVKKSLESAIADDTLTVAYRRKALTGALADAVIRYATGQVGKKYNYSGAAGGGIRDQCDNHPIRMAILLGVSAIAACAGAEGGHFSSSDKFYCSELVLAAFNAAAMPIITGQANTSTPKDIVTAYSQGVLLYVGHL